MEKETTVFHYLFSAMGLTLFALIGWIGVNVAHIPVIDEEIHNLKHTIEDVLDKQIADHESRIRDLEHKR